MIEPVSPLAQRGFGAAADAYERGRPDYPTEAVTAIVERLGLGSGRTVLDLAAGTGKMTRRLVSTGARVIAVEPVAGMRAKLAETAPTAEALDGSAEAIPLPNASVDAAVVAQAFHWFDAGRALSELHRVVRPGGGLVLAWNLRDESVHWVRRLGELMDRATGGEAPSTQHGWQARFARSGCFEPLEVLSFRHVQRLTVEGVLDRVASVSTVAAAEPAVRADLLDAVRALLAEDPETAGRAVVELPYETTLHVTRRRGAAPGSTGTTGLVVSVNRNDGGVPKLPVDRARIGRLGLDGDGHDQAVHGGERGAVCLYAQEAIERVRADGHQAFPGSYGENLTLLGIELGTLAAGDRIELGFETGPLLELTMPAAPCQAQARWFIDARIARISHAIHPEDARWYARVLREGDAAPGMAVRVLPGPEG